VTVPAEEPLVVEVDTDDKVRAIVVTARSR
jgi:hypothetical protein